MLFTHLFMFMVIVFNGLHLSTIIVLDCVVSILSIFVILLYHCVQFLRPRNDNKLHPLIADSYSWQ